MLGTKSSGAPRYSSSCDITEAGDETQNGGQVQRAVQKVQLMTELTAIDLFCGAGGLSRGFSTAGWKILLGVDHWPRALETFAVNHPGSKTWFTSIDRSVTGTALLERAQAEHVDALIGGPPCQGFSTLGKRTLEDARNMLVWEFLRLVSELKPRAFLMENVDGLRVAKVSNESLSRTLVREFSALGYSVSYGMLLAANYGVPQLRRRVVFVGLRDGRNFDFPCPSHHEATWPTVWGAIGDLPEVQPGEAAYEYVRLPETALQRELRGSNRALQGHEAVNHASNLVRAISFIPDGGNRKSIPDQYQPRSGFHNSYARFRSDRPAIAVTTVMGKPSSTRCIHPFQHRSITPREGARLQTFQDNFHFTGTRWEQYEQIGNSVPVHLARLLGEQLALYLTNSEYQLTDDGRRRSRLALLDALFTSDDAPPRQLTLLDVNDEARVENTA